MSKTKGVTIEGLTAENYRLVRRVTSLELENQELRAKVATVVTVVLPPPKANEEKT